MTQEKKVTVKHIVPEDKKDQVKNVDHLVYEFSDICKPLEDILYLLLDVKTLAWYCECHVSAGTLVKLSTTDVPLDPEEQSEYRANREIVTSHVAFDVMKTDAKARRSFSNIVLEYSTDHDPDHPLKIIGGQHRFEAIKLAYEGTDGLKVNENHGIKVYFGLDLIQRLDVQLISNTVIAVASDLYDRMQETARGPELRNWCQKVGLLANNTDFADKRQRGYPITVRLARTFILNYFLGLENSSKNFEKIDTTPVLCKSGESDPKWEKIRDSHPGLWNHTNLVEAGKNFASLIEVQRNAFAKDKDAGKKHDFGEKALSYAVLAAWAYIAGMLHGNKIRIARHYNLIKITGKDPLNAAALAKGRHKSDPENYRGLGYRTDPKERGRFVELFYLQAERGGGITSPFIDLAIKRYQLKQANLDVIAADEESEE